MRKKTIKELKEKFKTRKITEAQINQLRQDQRIGVQNLIKTYERQKEKQKEAENKFFEMLAIERELWEKSDHLIAGVDEAGRGPLAGPVVAAAVIIPKDFQLIGINDSKQLNGQQLKKYAKLIKQKCISYKISIVDHDFIDHTNILTATKKAMTDALLNIDPLPTYALIDAVSLKNINIPTDNIVKGDEKSISIAAASILAKVSRDEIMQQMDEKYPEYDFYEHKGYGTKKHLKKIAKYGVSPIHRKSFAPVKKYLT